MVLTSDTHGKKTGRAFLLNSSFNIDIASATLGKAVSPIWSNLYSFFELLRVGSFVLCSIIKFFAISEKYILNKRGLSIFRILLNFG